jgi:hypothetical protein
MRNSFASRERAAINAQKKPQQVAKLEGALAESNLPTPKTILDAVETVVEYAVNSELSETFFEVAGSHLDYIAARLGITSDEALMLSVAVNVGANCRLTLRELAEFFDCSRVKVLKYAKHLDSLVERKYMRIAQQGDADLAYVLKYQVEEAVKKDEPYHFTPISNLNDEQLFEEIHKLIKCRRYHLLDFNNFMDEVEQLLDANSKLQFPRELKTLSLRQSEKALLICACDMLVNKGDEIISNDDYENLFDSRSMFIRLRKSLSNETSALIKQGLLKRASDEHLVIDDMFMLTNKVRTEMLSSVGITELKTETVKNRDLVYPATITAKELFFNPSEEHQISRLVSLLQPDAFNNICSRLDKQGMRKGFACLFYGMPGTGKTETVLQLARKTGRALMQVNISEIRDKWVGETEKNIKGIFERYRTLLKSEPIAPILFFNEADAIFTKRSQNSERSVDKMENAMQNIILQEIESLEGILIATTNLTSNLDKAFERRFIYKIEFNAPSLEAKQSIWLSMIPSLGESNASTLASAYNFSGGQIENIARKHTIEHILSGEEPTMAAIRKLCDDECLCEVKPRRAVGF